MSEPAWSIKVPLVVLLLLAFVGGDGEGRAAGGGDVGGGEGRAGDVGDGGGCGGDDGGGGDVIVDVERVTGVIVDVEGMNKRVRKENAEGASTEVDKRDEGGKRKPRSARDASPSDDWESSPVILASLFILC